MSEWALMCKITKNLFDNLMLDELFLEYIPSVEKYLTSDCDEIIRPQCNDPGIHGK